VVGTGLVSADGTTIETISGGIRASDWHFTLPPPPSPPEGGSENSENNQKNQDPTRGSCLTCPSTNSSSPQSGGHRRDPPLPSHRSLGVSRNVEFIYNSLTAYPRPVIPFDSTIPVRSAVPPTISYKISVAGVDQENETFVSTAGLSESVDETIRGAVALDASSFETGVYPYALRLTSNYPSSRVSTTVRDRLLVTNETGSPFGVGWSLKGLQRLHLQADGRAVLTEAGSAMVFSPGSGLISSWPGEGDANDNFGSNDGTLQGGVTFAPGQVGQAFSFDGVNDFVDFGNVLNFERTDLFTFTFWIQQEATLSSSNFIIAKQDNFNPQGSNNRQGYLITTRSDGKIAFSLINNQLGGVSNWLGVLGSTNIRDGVFHHVAVTYDGSSTAGGVSIYVDGVAEILNVISDTLSDTTRTTESFRFGAREGATFALLDGLLDEVQAYDRALSADEIQAIFNGGGNSTGDFAAPAGDFSILSENADRTFTRTLKDGTKINFDSQGLQTSLVDRNGNTTTYDYDGNGKLISITDPANLVTTLTYTGDILSSVTDPANRTTSFQHDAEANLTKITNPDSSTESFAYDSRHLLTDEINQRGFLTTHEYDFAGRFVRTNLPDSSTRQMTASQLVGLVNTSGGLGTSPANPAPIRRPEEALGSFTDGAGNSTQLKTDSLGAITRQVDALGRETLIERDDHGLPTKTTRPNGAVLEMTYDAKGNLLTSKDPVGTTTTFTYDPTFNQVTSITDPKNNTTTINYDGNGNPEEIIDALGNRTMMTYDGRGLLRTVTSAVGEPEENTTTFTYDPIGNLITTTDPLGNVTTLEYDAAGNVIKSTDAEGRVTEFSYDSMNRLISVTDPNLQVTSYNYDSRGNLTQVTDAKNQITSFNYDALDRLALATNPLGLPESFTYDANGNLISTINRNGQTLTFGYDALNRLTQKSLPPSMSQAGLQVTTFSYDSVGNLTKVSNPATNVFNQYDLANRLVSSTSSVEETVPSVFTVIHRNTLIDEDNQEFEGKSIRVEGQALTVNGSHTFANLVLVNGAVLNHSSTTSSKVIKAEITITNTLLIDPTSGIDVSARGFLGGRQPGNPNGLSGTTKNFALGSTSNSGGSYGGSGAGTSPNPVYGIAIDPNDLGSGGATSGTAAGNGGGLIRIVARTIQLDGSIVADGGAGGIFGGGGSGGGIRIDVGTLAGAGSISANGGRGGTTTGGASIYPGGGGGRIAVYYEDIIGFDQANIMAAGGASTNPGQPGTVHMQQFISMLLPPEVEEPIIRNAEAEIDSPVQFASLNTVAIESNKLAIHSEAEIPNPLLFLNQLISDAQSQLPDISHPQRRVFSSQSKIENLKSKIYENRYLALAAAQVDDDFDPDPIYIYDLNGNRTAMIDPTGLTTYNYDELNRLASITNNGGLTTNISYDALGRRTSMTRDNGVVTTYNYDAASQLLSLVHEHNLTTINSFNYTYDKVGNRITKTDNTTALSYTYDALNRLTKVADPTPIPPETYVYDEVGNRTDSNQNGDSVFNNSNQLEQDANFTYTYDNNGNQIQKTNNTTGAFTLYEYDAENKLIRVVREDGSIVNYKYDGLGRRIEKEVDSVVTQYIYDNEDLILEIFEQPDPSSDITGPWVAIFSAFGGPATDSCNWSVVQSGNNLSFTGSCNFATTVNLSGTIDTSTGAFTASGPATSSCRSLNISGTVSSDGSFMNGDDFFCTGREFGGTFTAEREFDISNNIIARYTHGPGIDEPLVIEKGGASFYYHADGLGNITELTDTSGTVVQAYSYSSFGKIESQLDPNFIQPYAFTAREFDPETALYFYRTRYYDPTTARFLSRDQLNPGTIQLPFAVLSPSLVQNVQFFSSLTEDGNPLSTFLSGGQDVFHPYVYVYNNPIVYRDSFGLVGIGANPIKGIFAGGTGELVGGIAGAIIIGGLTQAFVPFPGSFVVGGIIGGQIGAVIGGLFDHPCDGQLNCGEDNAYPPPPPPLCGELP